MARRDDEIETYHTVKSIAQKRSHKLNNAKNVRVESEINANLAGTAEFYKYQVINSSE